MKRFFLFIFLGVILCSCNNLFKHDFKITNDSTEEVSFTINGYEDKIYKLSSNESIILNLYSNPQFTFNPANPRLSYASGTSTSTIYHRKNYQCIVENKTSRDINFYEVNNLALNDNNETEFNLQSGQSIIISVYTENPQFYNKTEQNNYLFDVSKTDNNFVCTITEKT